MESGDESVNSSEFQWKLLFCGGKALSVCSSCIEVLFLTQGLFFLLRTSPNLVGGGGWEGRSISPNSGAYCS